MLTQGTFERLLDDWIAAGRIGADQRAVLLDEARAAGRLARPGTVVAVFAAVLIVLAVIAFVAANWQAMPRLARLAAVVGALAAAHGGALVVLSRDEHGRLGHALLLVAAGTFGAALALVSQIYHLSGDLSRLLAVWGVGALALGLAGRSRAPLWLAGGLFVWAGLDDAAWRLPAAGSLVLLLWPMLRWRLGVEWAAWMVGVVVLAYADVPWDTVGVGPLLAAHLFLWSGALALSGWWPGGGALRAVNLVLALGFAVAGGFKVFGLSVEEPALQSVDWVTLPMALAGAGLAGGLLVRRAAPATEAAALVVLAALAVLSVFVAPSVLVAWWVWPGGLLAIAVLLTIQGARLGAKALMTAGVLLFIADAAAVYMGPHASLMAAAGFFLAGAMVLGGGALLAVRRSGEAAP